MWRELAELRQDAEPLSDWCCKGGHVARWCIFKFGARAKEALIEAMSGTLAAVSAEDMRGFFDHHGYRTRAPQLRKAL
jgi:hypothetical protein